MRNLISIFIYNPTSPKSRNKTAPTNLDKKHKQVSTSCTGSYLTGLQVESSWRLKIARNCCPVTSKIKVSVLHKPIFIMSEVLLQQDTDLQRLPLTNPKTPHSMWACPAKQTNHWWLRVRRVCKLEINLSATDGRTSFQSACLKTYTSCVRRVVLFIYIPH